MPKIVLAGAAALALAAFVPPSAAAPPEACWPGTALSARPGEAQERPMTAADRVARPAAATPGPAVPARLSGVIRRVEVAGGRKLVALTFDLCETGGTIAGYDGTVVDALRAGGAAATFFASGKWLATHEERAAQLLSDPLFAVEAHGWTHPNLHFAAPEAVAAEALTAEAGLAAARTATAAVCPVGSAAADGATPLFRFPFGSCSPEGVAAANAAGMAVIQWDVVPGDPGFVDAKTIARAVVDGVRPGSIVVMHANGRGRHTGEALAIIVPALKARGYEFVTVDALLAAGTPVTAETCYVTRPGDTAAYDRKLAKAAPAANPAAKTALAKSTPAGSATAAAMARPVPLAQPVAAAGPMPVAAPRRN